jgi:hypothetical protein
MPIVEVPAVDLQSTVDRFAQSLKVAASLYSLHPRNADLASRALRPAMVMCVIAAFEGFAEDMLAVGMHIRKYTLLEISRTVDVNNPDLVRFEKEIDKHFPGTLSERDHDSFRLELWRQPTGDSGWWPAAELTWTKTKDEAMAWMQVRHCLAHGIVSGWGGEHWPLPTKKGVTYAGPHASSVLRETGQGLYSLAIRCALNCCRIYRYGAQHLADQLAKKLIGQELDWSKVPDFPLD